MDVRRWLTGPTGRWHPISAGAIELFNPETIPIIRYRTAATRSPNLGSRLPEPTHRQRPRRPGALQGHGAFGRFKDQLHEGFPELIALRHALRDGRAQRRAVDWLLAQGLVDQGAAEKFAADRPEPGLP